VSFQVGDLVQVLTEQPEGNPRTPRYLRGRTGRVTHSYGVIDNPLDHAEPYPPLYTVVFEAGRDSISADLHEDWLEPA
jgi:hypothetical protein